MKIRVEIPDALAAEARRLAAEERTTLRALILAGLRLVLEERRRRAESFRLRDASFRGNGLQAGYRAGDWDGIRDAAYEGHGA